MKHGRRSLHCLTFVFILLCFSAPLFGEGRTITHDDDIQIYGVYYFGDQDGYGTVGGFAPISYSVVPNSETPNRADDPGRELGTTWGSVEAKATYAHTITVPFLAGKGPFFQGNNLAIKLGGELSPVHMKAVTQLKLTPIAFLSVALGGEAGTGWNFFGLFNGLGLNLPGKEYTGPLTEPLPGAVFDIWLSATFQFDLAALWPGEWHHVVTQLAPSIHWTAFTAADEDQAWQWEADSGENFNGWKLEGSYFVGYQMPIALDTVGFLLETEQYIGAVSRKSPMAAAGGWGSDFVNMKFGPLANFALSESLSLATLIQFEREKDYSDETIGNRYFEYRDYTDDYIDLYRIVFIFGIKW